MNTLHRDWIPLVLGMVVILLSILLISQGEVITIAKYRWWQELPLTYYLACGLFLGGAGLIFLMRSRYITGALGAFLIIQGLAGLTLFNIHQLPHIKTYTDQTFNDLPSVAVCFALVGLAYMIISFYGFAKKYIVIANVILLVTTVMTFLSIFNDLYTVPSQNIWLQMPYQVGIGFILISISCFILLWDKRRINHHSRSAFNAVICGIASFTLFALFSLSFKNTTLEHKKQTAQLQSKILKNTISVHIEEQVNGLFQLINSIERQHGLNDSTRIHQLHEVLKDKPFVDMISIQAGNNQSINIASPTYKNMALPTAIPTQQHLSSSLADTNYHLSILSPETAIISDADQDFIVLNLNTLIKSIWDKQYFIDPINIKITQGNYPIFSTFEPHPIENHDIFETQDEINLFGTPFAITFKINTWYFEHNQPNFSLIFFIFGFFISILFVLLIRAREISNYRLKSLYKMVRSLKRTKSHLKQITRIDYLTGISNRSAMMEQLEIEISKSERNHTKFAVMFIDIDNFKQINDFYGHSCGDSILKDVTSRLKCSIRKSDYIARFAGDEFIILAPEMKSYDGIEVLASRCIKAFQTPFTCNDNLIEISPSIGISSYPTCGRTPDELIKNADIAMYKAKQQGKNNFKIFNDDINHKVIRQHQVKLALEKALINDEFHLEYQPIVSLKHNTVIGIETLLRWKNEKVNNPSPSEFIPLAESSHLINPIGNWVLNQAISDYKTIVGSLSPNNQLFLSINLSHIQLLTDHAFNNLSEILIQHCDIPVVLEVKEEIALQYTNLIKNRLNRLHSCNISLALDDFAKFNTSLSNLSALPVRYVKIDQAIITKINDSEHANKTVEGILALTKELGITAIAKGVETEEQITFLKKNTCTHIQGYSYSKPLTLANLIQLRFSN